MTFRIGQQVISIKQGQWHDQSGKVVVGPSFGEVCVIRGFDATVYAGLLLVGYHGEYYQDFHERGYSQTRFRPIVSRKTDISALQALLVPGTKILEVCR